jgi:hypothetical protein
LREGGRGKDGAREGENYRNGHAGDTTPDASTEALREDPGEGRATASPAREKPAQSHTETPLPPKTLHSLYSIASECNEQKIT